MEGLFRVLEFAAKAHTDQRRKNVRAEPYINHPIAVAAILSKVGVTDINILSAALLHDVVEDTSVLPSDLNALFGPTITELVRKVSDDKSLPKAERKRLQIEHAKVASPGAKLIKMADKIDNLSGLLYSAPVGWTEKRIQGYMVWSKAVTNNLVDLGSYPSIRLADKLRAIFNSQFYSPTRGMVDCIPKNVNLDEFLEEYYAEMSSCKN